MLYVLDIYPIIKYFLASVRRLIRDWAPLVWLAPGERFLPLGVTEFLDNVQSDQYYLRTRIDVGKCSN